MQFFQYIFHLLQRWQITACAVVYEVIRKTFVLVFIVCAEFGKMVCLDNSARTIIATYTMNYCMGVRHIELGKQCNSFQQVINLHVWFFLKWYPVIRATMVYYIVSHFFSPIFTNIDNVCSILEDIRIFHQLHSNKRMNDYICK